MKPTIRKKLLPQVIASLLASSMAYADVEELGVISVTANKIEEDIKDVPQSITVIDETLIEEKGIKDVIDIIDTIPNIDWISTGGHARKFVNVRGLNTSVFTSNNPIVIYVDGVPYSDSYGFDLSLANIERVEVLRGPQGTLYGKDAIGGVINVVTKQPTNEWTGKAGVEYGTNNYRELKFNANGALKEDQLYLGVNGQYRADDGWITNNYPGSEKDANKFLDRRLSAYLLWQPTEEFSSRLTISNDYTDSFGTDGYFILNGTGSLSDFSREVAENQNYVFDTNEELKINSQSLQLSYDLGNATIASVTTHRDQKMEAIYNFDDLNNTLGSFGPAPFQFDNQDRETWTQELTLKSNNSVGLRYVAGVYLDTSDREQGPYGQEFFGNNVNAESNTDSDTAAVFGQVIYPVTERLDLTLGGRYQRIKKKIDLDFLYNRNPLNTLDGDRNWSKFLPKAALNYRVNNNLSVYGSYSKGYMPGGFNFFAASPTFTPGPLPLEDNVFDPQISTNYEIGLKSQTDNMTLGLALFYMDIKDIHVYTTDDLGNFFTDNAQEAHSKGIELEVTYQVTNELKVNASVGLIDAEYDKYDAGGGVNYDGEDVEQTPDYTVNLGLAYYNPNGFYGRTDLKMIGESSFFDSGRQTFPTRDSYKTVDARVGYLWGDWEVYAFAKNLTDEEFVTGYRSINFGPMLGMFSGVSFNDPRTIGAGVKYEF